MNNSFLDFNPALIVEATSVCDRSCRGCYAPNVVSRENIERFFSERPDLFLNPKSFRESLSKVIPSAERKIGSASIRGGEPTRHPKLLPIIEILSQFAEKVFLETHGRWILQSETNYTQLLEGCRKYGAIIKISFDRMHDQATFPLRKVTNIFENMGIEFVIAITEVNEAEFMLTRALCPWVPDSRIVFQKKARTSEELIMPEIGVVRVNGTISHTLNSKISFQSHSSNIAEDTEAIA